MFFLINEVFPCLGPLEGALLAMLMYLRSRTVHTWCAVPTPLIMSALCMIEEMDALKRSHHAPPTGSLPHLSLREITCQAKVEKICKRNLLDVTKIQSHEIVNGCTKE